MLEKRGKIPISGKIDSAYSTLHLIKSRASDFHIRQDISIETISEYIGRPIHHAGHTQRIHRLLLQIQTNEQRIFKISEIVANSENAHKNPKRSVYERIGRLPADHVPVSTTRRNLSVFLAQFGAYYCGLDNESIGDVCRASSNKKPVYE